MLWKMLWIGQWKKWIYKNCTKKNTTKQYKYNTKPENLIKSEKKMLICVAKRSQIIIDIKLKVKLFTKLYI